MNRKFKKTIAIAILFAIVLSASSLTAAANGIDIRTIKAPVDPTKNPFEPTQEAPVPEDYQVRDSNVNQLTADVTTASSDIYFTGNVEILWNESFPESSWVNAIQVRDLDGDKKDDLILVVNDWSTNTYTVIAKRGSDGTHLWEESVTGNAWIDVKGPSSNVSKKGQRLGDLDGDRLPDVVLTIKNWDTNTHTVIAKKGNDGTRLWEKSVTGNAWITAEFIDDLSRDRLADVLVTVNDWSANAYTMSANRGNDGEQLWQESGSGDAWISGAKDFNGDKYVDLLVTINSWSTSTYKVIAKKGNDGEQLWQESVTGNAWIEAIPAKDLNGDRIDDVMVTIHNWGTNTHTAIAKQGSDGADLWQETITGNSWLYATPADDLNGDRTADVLVTTDNWSSYTYSVTAKQGSDGADLWQETITGNSWLYATPADDLNGDRTADVLVTTSNWSSYTYSVTAKQGSDGADLWQEVVTGDGIGLFATPTEDLNGDRTADVLVATSNWSSYTYSVTAKQGSDGADLWQEVITGDLSWLYATLTDDLNGDRTADVLVTTSNRSGNTYGVTAKRGSDGANLWQASSNTDLRSIPIGDLDRDRRENTLISSSNSIYAVGIPK